MKIQKWLISLGIAGVVFFVLMDVFGSLSWREYNPVSDYLSKMLTEEAPNSKLNKTFMNLYNVCFSLFTLNMIIFVFRRYRLTIKMGFFILFLMSLLSLFGYGTVPISLDFVFAASNDVMHIVITLMILCLTFLALILLSIGYLQHERLQKIGKMCVACTVSFFVLNVWHIIALFSGWNILGLIQRLTFYSFHVFTCTISWIYAKRYAALN